MPDPVMRRGRGTARTNADKGAIRDGYAFLEKDRDAGEARGERLFSRGAAKFAEPRRQTGVSEPWRRA